MKIIRINGIEYALYPAGENTDVSVYPHMVMVSSGEIPKGNQKRLLTDFLRANGVTPIKKANTHWYIEAALKLESGSAAVVSAPPKNQQKKQPGPSPYLLLNEENIEEQDRLVKASSNYGKESQIIHDVLNASPKNTDINTVAMKAAVIDVTNSTHLSQHKSDISLYDIAELIVRIKDFDERVKNGDPELVRIIAKNTGAKNLFSFASKYCTYHNVEIYGRDDYSIFDGIVKAVLPHYLNGVTQYKIETWRQTYNYEAFNDCIGKLLDDNGIHIPFRRRKFDHFLWYANR